MRIVIIFLILINSLLFSRENLKKEIAISLEEQKHLHEELQKFTSIKQELEEIEEKLHSQLSYLQQLLEKEQQEAFSKQKEQISAVRKEIKYFTQD